MKCPVSSQGTKILHMATSVELVEQSLQASEYGLEESENLVVLSSNLETETSNKTSPEGSGNTVADYAPVNEKEVTNASLNTDSVLEYGAIQTSNPKDLSSENVESQGTLDIADKTYNPLNDEEEESDSETAVTNIRSKKIRPDPKSWKKNVNKAKVAGGKARRARNDNVIREKQIGRPCKETCSLQCSKKISVDQRKLINAQFWGENKGIDMKRQFVARMINCFPVARVRETTGVRSETFVTTALQKKKQDGGIIEIDQRGNDAANKIPEYIKQTSISSDQVPLFQGTFFQEIFRKENTWTEIAQRIEKGKVTGRKK
nr:unnamed protein product [Callosobruchus analis]